MALAAWALVTATTDRSSLVMIRRVIGEHDLLAAGVVAAVIVVPVAVDAWRFLPRYGRRWLARTRGGNESAWAAEVPLQGPRVFRAGKAELSWRERAIVEQGQYAVGRVVHHGDLTGVRFDAPWGDTIASRPVSHRGERPPAETPLALLYEPGAHVGVAPSLLDLAFLQPVIVDSRKPLASTTRSASPTPTPLTVPLVATLHPVERMARYLDAHLGDLTIDDDRITLHGADRTWAMLHDKASMRVSACLLPGKRAEVTIEITHQRDGAYRAHDDDPLRFKTELPQRRLSPALPLAWSDAPYISEADFNHIWPHLVAVFGIDHASSVAM